MDYLDSNRKGKHNIVGISLEPFLSDCTVDMSEIQCKSMPVKHIWPPNTGLLQKQQCPIYWSYCNPRSRGSRCTHQDLAGFEWFNRGQVLLPMTTSALCHTAFPSIGAEQTPFLTCRYITSRCSDNKVNVHHQIPVPAPLSGMEGTGSAVQRRGVVLFGTLQAPGECGHPPWLAVQGSLAAALRHAAPLQDTLY